MAMGPPGTEQPGGLGREELQALYRLYAPVVFRRARRMLGREADALDAVQEVFERMWKHSREFRAEARPMTWVYRIATNVCLNLLRSRGVREGWADGAEEPSSSGSEAESRNLLRVWLAHLDQRELAIATLLYIDGLTQEEAAQVLGLSRKTIGREVEKLRGKAALLGTLPAEAGHG